MIAAPRLNKLSLVLLTGIGLAGPSSSVLAQGMGGPNMGGPRMGMERMGERVKERCEQFEARLDNMDKKLSTEQVRDIVAGHLAQSGESHIKAGKAQAKSDGVVSVEIVTADGSLVTTREISTKTGCRSKPASAATKSKNASKKSASALAPVAWDLARWVQVGAAARRWPCSASAPIATSISAPIKSRSSPKPG